jgi:hypothetical protein
MLRHVRGVGVIVLLWVVGAAGAIADARRAEQEAAPSAAVTTCVRSWVDQESRFEEYLHSATVPIGVTKPKRAFFAPGGLVKSAAWKPLPPGRRGGYWESYKSEIAAYELDKLLALGMVPPVVERTVDGETGAAVLWVEPVKGWNKDKPVQGPEPEWSRQISRMKLFDQLIANIDRNQGNLIYDADWHLFLIDHSRAFTDRRTLSGIATPTRVDRDLWDRMMALTRDDLQRVLGKWIDGRAIDALLARRELMRQQIQRDVVKLGEAAVFRP